MPEKFSLIVKASTILKIKLNFVPKMAADEQVLAFFDQTCSIAAIFGVKS